MKAKDKPDHWKQCHYYDRNKLNSVGKKKTVKKGKDIELHITY